MTDFAEAFEMANTWSFTTTLLWNLCSDGYWKRMWVIQECSLARKIRIMYGRGKNVVDWETFIMVLKEPEIQGYRTDEASETNRAEIQDVARSHNEALRKEPHDKVYGFIGLASATINGFPTDYGKTLFEVWKDTMLFKNSDADLSWHDIMRFRKLVQKLLGGPGIAKADEVNQAIWPRLRPGEGIDKRDEQASDRTTPSIPARLIGRINYLGPTTHEIISELKQTAIWRSSINKYLPQYQRAAAREESD